MELGDACASLTRGFAALLGERDVSSSDSPLVSLISCVKRRVSWCIRSMRSGRKTIGCAQTQISVILLTASRRPLPALKFTGSR